MAFYRTDWLVASYALLPEQDITIAGSAETVPASSYYLHDAVPALSLLAQVQAAMTAAGVAGASVVLLANRKVRLSGGGVFTVTWTDTLLRNLLGFSANLAGAASYVAPLISPLFWSPGTPGKSLLTGKGLTGHPEELTYQSVASYSGRTESVSHGTRLYNRFQWTYIDADRIVTSSALGGEFGTWFSNVAPRAARFKIYHDVQEDPTSATVAAPLTTVLGPYIYSADRKGVSWTYDRSKGFDWTDESCDILMNVHVCPEYTY